MTHWQQLVQQGILGTNRQPTIPPLPPTLEEWTNQAQGNHLSANLSTEVETRFLQQAAMLTQYEAVGLLPLALDEDSGLCEINTAPSEPHPPVGGQATKLLHQLLNNFDLKLLIEWLNYAATAGQVVPAAALPTLLDQATKQAALADMLLPCIGERGRWLLALNPAWQNLQSLDFGLVNWQEGTLKARSAYLEDLRRYTPEEAQSLLAAVWHEEAAAERTALVAALRINLSDADLPFLAEAVTDRSINVRITVARMLATLPASALHQQLRSALTAHLRIERKWLKRHLVITLPNHFREEWHEWGIREQSPLAVRIGQKMGWLVQLITLLPPSLLVSALETDAVDLLELIRATDHAEALLTAILEGAEQHRDHAFLMAELDHLLRLLKLSQVQPREFIERYARYAPILQADQQEKLFTTYVNITKTSAFPDWTTLQQAVRHFRALPAALTDWLLTEQIPLLLKRNTRDYGVGRILIDLAYQLDPSGYPQAHTLFQRFPFGKDSTSAGGEERPDYIDRFLQIYHLRRQMVVAFTESTRSVTSIDKG